MNQQGCNKIWSFHELQKFKMSEVNKFGQDFNDYDQVKM